jgi:hypothetical protein
MKKNDLVQGGELKIFELMDYLHRLFFLINRSQDNDSNRKHSKRKTRE